MLVQSINPTQIQTNTNFKSKIIGKEVINSAKGLALESAESSVMKSLNYGKKFFDSINKIKNDKHIRVVEFIKTEAGVNVYADNKEVLALTKNAKEQDSYLAVQAVNKYADTLLTCHKEVTVLDAYQETIKQIAEELDKMKELYSTNLKNMIKNI